MARPIALCIEDLEGREAERYLRCVALPGIEAGLALDAQGAAVWKKRPRGALEIWVSADERLMLFRPLRGSAATLRRGGRALEVPVEKPVVLLDQDLIEAGGRKLRLHVHGIAESIHPPAPLRDKNLGGVGRVAAAATFALGAAVAAVPDAYGSAEPPAIEVRDHPPKIAPPTKDTPKKAPPKKKPVEKKKKDKATEK
jgi:hypothetical protein